MENLNPVEWAIRPVKKYAVFSGRAPRAEYWWFYLGTIVVQIPLTVVDKVTGDGDALSNLFSLAMLLPWLGVTVRRLHDTNRSGWWLIGFVMVFVVGGALLAMGVMSGAAGGAGGFTAAVLAAILVFIISVTMLVFMILPGTEGPNDYGSDPYGRDNLEEVFA